jgi:hypothetical protein
LMNAHQQRGLRRVGGYGNHGGHGDAVTAGRTIGGHDIDGGSGLTHAKQESLAQYRINLAHGFSTIRTPKRLFP